MAANQGFEMTAAVQTGLSVAAKKEIVDGTWRLMS
jgi:hypothetical protein